MLRSRVGLRSGGRLLLLHGVGFIEARYLSADVRKAADDTLRIGRDGAVSNHSKGPETMGINIH